MQPGFLSQPGAVQVAEVDPGRIVADLHLQFGRGTVDHRLPVRIDQQGGAARGRIAQAAVHELDAPRPRHAVAEIVAADGRHHVAFRGLEGQGHPAHRAPLGAGVGRRMQNTQAQAALRQVRPDDMVRQGRRLHPGVFRMFHARRDRFVGQLRMGQVRIDRPAGRPILAAGTGGQQQQAGNQKNSAPGGGGNTDVAIRDVHHDGATVAQFPAGRPSPMPTPRLISPPPSPTIRA